MLNITKTYTITADPGTLQRFENLMGLLHYNGGSSGYFALAFDGDGNDRFKCEPAPTHNKTGNLIASVGPCLVVAFDNHYSAIHLDYAKPTYTAKNGQLIKYNPDLTEEIVKDINKPE